MTIHSVQEPQVMTSVSDQNAVRYGIAGLGRAGWSIHVARLRDRIDSRIVAVADPDVERRQQAETELSTRSYASLDEMLRDDEVEVVVVATPSISHAPDTLAALAAGKHVLVEKPMGLDAAEAQCMIDRAQEVDRQLFVHHQRRFSRDFTHFQEVIASGVIGPVYHIRNYIQAFDRRNDWQTLRKYGGGVLNNTCTHFLDMSLQLVGSPIVEVFADLKQVASAGDAEDHVKAMLRAENGVTIDMEISKAQMVRPPLPVWIICGASGTLTSDGKMSRIEYFDPGTAPPLEVVEGPAKDRQYGNGDVLSWTREERPTIGPDVGDFYDQVRDVLREGAPMRVTPESVREVMRLVERIRESAGASQWFRPSAAVK